jgi:hypothetical protein
MAKKDLKISHEKEYKYDILAKVITVYNELQQKMDELKDARKEYLQEKEVSPKKINKMLKDLEKDESLVELSLYLSYYTDYPDSYHVAADLFSTREKARNLKQQNDPESQKKRKELTIRAKDLEEEMTALKKRQQSREEQVKPVDRTVDKLGLLSKGIKPENVISKWRNFGEVIRQQDWYKNLDLPDFHYPQGVTGMSFEVYQDEKSPGFVDFREFYSTYKGEKEEEVPIEANQVVASSSPLAASKLLVLDQKKQQEYYKKVLKPLLVNYYIATSETKEEAAEKFRADQENMNTISDVVDLIQD